MKVIARPRRSGRTDELIRLAHEADLSGEVCYIVCHSRQEAHRIAQRAAELELPVRFPVQYDELPVGRGSFTTCVVVDNAEMLIERIVGRRVEAIVVTDAGEVET